MKSNCSNNILQPTILSVSRETDVPAFYADWFLRRWSEGWCGWTNPFNNAVFHVSFEKVRCVVFWSKNPRPLLNRLDELEKQGCRNYYFQFTLNDYMREGLEPNVPPVDSRIDTFRRLAERIGSSRVVWRFDPLILSDEITVEELLSRIESIGSRLKGYTEKVVFSFADISAYRKVRTNLVNTSCREFLENEKLRFVEGLVKINSRLFGLQLATCAEGIDLARYGVAHNKCIDDELMTRLFNDDSELMAYIGAEYDLLDGWTIKKSKKDKGQRKSCGCVVSKDIGAYNTCPHLCRYCYANASDSLVLSNWRHHCGGLNDKILL